MKASERARVVQALRKVPTYYEDDSADCHFIDLLAQAIGARHVDCCACRRHNIPTAYYSDIVERLVELIEPQDGCED